ncbi:hypothetical protein PN498_19125 [Oscillatoria sp. CS-180]|uniref:hypothetical protein n=1 Tax=Oscillatoria sp. CS-180 TaxID=3021720 RepID=UPI00232FC3F7|nr:hypothetical protein [Oscillatoria sp. CS-180]MDB9528113.1 hypothetical protein [Oscillatoria sp. CS-180]
MHFWFLCCFLLFIVSQGYGWLSHQSWFAIHELGLPWVMLGGVGLAIASNYSTLSPTAKPKATLSPPPSRSSQKPDKPPQIISEEPPLLVTSAAQKPISISFEIREGNRATGGSSENEEE